MRLTVPSIVMASPPVATPGPKRSKVLALKAGLLVRMDRSAEVGPKLVSRDQVIHREVRQRADSHRERRLVHEEPR